MSYSRQEIYAYIYIFEVGWAWNSSTHILITPNTFRPWRTSPSPCNICNCKIIHNRRSFLWLVGPLVQPQVLFFSFNFSDSHVLSSYADNREPFGQNQTDFYSPVDIQGPACWPPVCIPIFCLCTSSRTPNWPEVLWVHSADLAQDYILEMFTSKDSPVKNPIFIPSM